MAHRKTLPVKQGRLSPWVADNGARCRIHAIRLRDQPDPLRALAVVPAPSQRAFIVAAAIHQETKPRTEQP
ncbi:TPA: hypothetical protein ACVSIG_004394 [Yersinia enterocolitica]